MLVVLDLIATEVATKTIGGASLSAKSVFTDYVRQKTTNVPVGTHNAVCFRVRQPDMWYAAVAGTCRMRAPWPGG